MIEDDDIEIFFLFKSGVYIKIIRQSNSVEQRGDYLIECLFSENYRNDILK